MRSIIFQLIVWNIYRFDNSIYKPIRYTFIICIAIALVYGLLLTALPGFNPYLMAILPLNGDTFNTEYAFSDDGRVFGRISSVFGHPMTFGLFCCLSTVYLYNIRNTFKCKFGYVLLVLSLLNIIFCGVRSSIGGLLIGLAVYLVLSRKIRLAIGIILSVICLVQIVTTIPGVGDYVKSVTDFDNRNQAVNGSTLDMRLEQLDCALYEIEDCPFVGRGYGWVQLYKETKGDHPILLAFESLVFTTLCNNGFLGILALLISIFACYRIKIKYKEKWNIIFTLYVTYLAYSCITGEYGYLMYTMIFYTIMSIDITNEINKNNNLKCNIRHRV